MGGNAKHKAYNRSEKGRARYRRYNQSLKGRERDQRYTDSGRKALVAIANERYGLPIDVYEELTLGNR